MVQNLVLALEITAIGMGLVFGSIILFWLLMAVMVRVTNTGLGRKINHKGHEGHEGLVNRGQPSDGGAPSGFHDEDLHDLRQRDATTEVRRRAAAVAVAVALACQGAEEARRQAGAAAAQKEATGAQASAWQVVQRARSLRIFRRGRAR